MAFAIRNEYIHRWSVSVDSMGNHQPGIVPSPPTYEPMPKTPLRPNSTATNLNTIIKCIRNQHFETRTYPKGSSRDGNNTKSLPWNTNGGINVNSALTYNRPGYFSISFDNFMAARRPYKSITGPTQIIWESSLQPSRCPFVWTSVRQTPIKSCFRLLPGLPILVLPSCF
jgi:hypothetical protein